MIKPHNDGVMDIKKPSPVSIFECILFRKIKRHFSEKKHISEWEIPGEDLLNHGRMVGRGTYGTVYKAEVRLHGMNKL